MDKNESIALYRQGKDAWNAWAMEVLDRRDDGMRWEKEALACFIGHEFMENEDFHEFVFPGMALFNNVRFLGDTGFHVAQFKGPAHFDGAKFEGAVLFDRVIFEDDAWFAESTVGSSASFKQAIFKREAWFHKMSFGSIACFERAVFQSYTDFSRVTFRTDADFLAVQARSAFMMFETNFSFVPNFEQASFMEAPRLDDINIHDPRKHLPTFSWVRIKTLFRGNRENEVRWRSLKRLALQGHNHLGVQQFFREELLVRRGVTDKYWQAPFWLGLFYQCVSDFGRSFGRPLLCWVVGLLTFAMLYNHLGNGTEFGEWRAAFGLSLHHGLASLSGFGDKLLDWYARLYGGQARCVRPTIPDGVSFLGVFQSMFSAVMIFLFLLALRNRFRIR